MIASDNKKKIAQNTLALYVRMIFVMGITLFSSRIVLEKLGITDFGVYSAVGGVVAMLSFLNGTLSTGTSRFITFELGKGNSLSLKETFSTAFHAHLILALIVSLILVLGGTWFIQHRLIIPGDLKAPALWTFYISIFTAFISITQVPYTALIIANEKMSIYAYVGIIEALGRLAIAYAISLSPINRIIWYALTVAVLQLLIATLYRIYCLRNYSESREFRLFNRKTFNALLKFSSWNLIANITQVLSTQGLIVIINMFFAPAVAAAQAIGNQISSAMAQFSANFMTAVNPQIIKLYSVGDYRASQQLNLRSTVLIWNLMLLIGLPLIVCMHQVMNLWLVDVPPYSVVFAQYIVFSQIINTFSMTFYVPMVASGKLRKNSFACIWISLIEFTLLYILLKNGFSVMCVQYITVLQAGCFSLIVKPYILCKDIGYSIIDLFHCYLQCLKTAIIPVLICITIFKYYETNANLWHVFLSGISIAISVIFSTLLFMKKSERQFIINMIKKHI